MDHLTASGSTKPILVVDDDPLMRSALTQSLGSRGYAVETAENGQQVLDRLGAGEAFAAVLLDLEMPVLDGMETLGRIKSTTPDLPVIVLTAKTARDTIERARALGAFDYMIKPPDLDRLTTLLSVCCTDEI